jgi:hypothetical protein
VVANDIDILIDSIGRTRIPGAFNALLRWPQLYEFAKLSTQKPPSLLDMEDQGMGLVLGEYTNTADIRVDAVGEREIHNPKLPPKGHRRLGTPAS